MHVKLGLLVGFEVLTAVSMKIAVFGLLASGRTETEEI
jgi:hypothetical protein